jgi:hypothetical protein
LVWLVERQRPDGAWPRCEAVAEASWAGAWAGLALARRGEGREMLTRAGAWLLAREGRRPGLLDRVLGHLMGVGEKVEQDLMLRGWPWHEDAISWVEPTASAVLALHALAERVPMPGAAARIAEAERLLWDRACVGGGWNYGNRRVLGEALPPFPDTTALALLALQGSPHAGRLRESFATLDRLLDPHASGLSLALAALAFELHGLDASQLRVRLLEGLARPVAPRETRSLAFMLLALSGGAPMLRIRA